MRTKVRIVLFSVAIVGVLGIGAASFIIFNPQAAADFTDNYLRPMVGNATIIYAEKAFYNTSDLLQGLAYKNGVVTAPQLLGDTGNTSLPTRLNLVPLVSPAHLTPVAGEGIWRNLSVDGLSGQEVMASTFIRPDSSRSYAFVTVLQIDSQALKMGIVAGIKNPGGSLGHPGPGVIPADIVNSGQVAAAFDGGFLYEDGNYGLRIGDITYAPLKNDVATLVSYADGTYKIINYTGQDLGRDVIFARQNCPMLIDNGELSVLDPKNKAAWGKTITSGTYTWRSGLGLTKEGDFVYAAGNNLTPATLASALQAAGAVSAMQLDINPAWVSFDLFHSTGSGTYSSLPLMDKMRDRTKQFLHGYNKDFFYLYQR